MPDLQWLLGALAAFGLAGAAIRWLRPQARSLRLLRAVLLGTLFLLGAGAASASGWYFWLLHRSQPPDVSRTLFRGITYTRESLRTPRPIVVHTVRVDLRAPGIRFLVTPGKPVPVAQLPARKTSRFLEEFGLQLAINGSYFKPWWSKAPWDYYPHAGDPVEVLGLASSEGRRYSAPDPARVTLDLSPRNDVTIGTGNRRPYNALSAGPLLLADGVPPPRLVRRRAHARPEPRSAVAIDRAGGTLYLYLVDGRQPHYSEGVTLPELAALIAERGGYRAMNLDGGGSSTLAVEGAGGRTEILNSTIHSKIPGRERPVANHLGIYALPTGGTDVRG
jgi:hypothetical protein